MPANATKVQNPSTLSPAKSGNTAVRDVLQHLHQQKATRRLLQADAPSPADRNVETTSLDSSEMQTRQRSGVPVLPPRPAAKTPSPATKEPQPTPTLVQMPTPAQAPTPVATPVTTPTTAPSPTPTPTPAAVTVPAPPTPLASQAKNNSPSALELGKDQSGEQAMAQRTDPDGRYKKLSTALDAAMNKARAFPDRRYLDNLRECDQDVRTRLGEFRGAERALLQVGADVRSGDLAALQQAASAQEQRVQIALNRLAKAAKEVLSVSLPQPSAAGKPTAPAPTAATVLPPPPPTPTPLPQTPKAPAATVPATAPSNQQTLSAATPTPTPTPTPPAQTVAAATMDQKLTLAGRTAATQAYLPQLQALTRKATDLDSPESLKIGTLLQATLQKRLGALAAEAAQWQAKAQQVIADLQPNKLQQELQLLQQQFAALPGPNPDQPPAPAFSELVKDLDTLLDRILKANKVLDAVGDQPDVQMPAGLPELLKGVQALRARIALYRRELAIPAPTSEDRAKNPRADQQYQKEREEAVSNLAERLRVLQVLTEDNDLDTLSDAFRRTEEVLFQVAITKVKALMATKAAELRAAQAAKNKAAAK